MPAPRTPARRRRKGVLPASRLPLALLLALALLVSLGLTSGCVAQAPPAPATIRQTPPPWEVPRDAISYIEAARLEPQPLDLTSNSRTLRLRVTVDGAAVEVPGYLGIDRPRAVQAAVHTHDSSGTVWLEGKDTDAVTLGQLFTVWGVRFDARCLGAACGGVTVTTEPASRAADPTTIRLSGVRSVTVTARSA